MFKVLPVVLLRRYGLIGEPQDFELAKRWSAIADKVRAMQCICARRGCPFQTPEISDFATGAK